MLAGSGLDGGAGAPEVLLGGSLCPVLSYNDTAIRCTVASAPHSEGAVSVRVPGVGDARGLIRLAEGRVECRNVGARDRGPQITAPLVVDLANATSLLRASPR